MPLDTTFCRDCGFWPDNCEILTQLRMEVRDNPGYRTDTKVTVCQYKRVVDIPSKEAPHGGD